MSGWLSVAVIVTVGLSGCGRLGYDPLADDGGADDGGATGADRGGGTGTITLGFSVAADIDDGMIRDGVHSMSGDSSNYLHMGRSAGASSWSYFRFRLPVAVPAGATITEVRLRLRAADANAWNESAHGLRVLVEDSPDAAPVTDAREAPDGSTPGFVRYPVPTTIDWGAGGLAWPTGQTLTSPDLSVAVQEVVDNHGGLADGAYLQFWVRGEGLTADGAVATFDSSGEVGAAAIDLRWTY